MLPIPGTPPPLDPVQSFSTNQDLPPAETGDLSIDAQVEAIESPATYAAQPPIPFEEEEAAKIAAYIDNALDAAISTRTDIDTDIERIRKYVNLSGKRTVSMADGTPAPEGTPNVLSPLIASKVRALNSNLESALMRAVPFYSASAHTPAAQKSVRVWEATMEQHLRTTEGFNEIKKAIWDAGTVHAAILKAHTEKPDELGGKPKLLTKFVQLEDFYAYPTSSVNLKNSATFERIRTVYGVLKYYADQGYYDSKAVEKIGNQSQARPSPTQEAIKVSDANGNMQGTDLEPVEYWEVFIRYEGTLYRAWYCDLDQVLLRIEPADLPFDEPPYEVIQPEDVSNSLYSIPPALLLLDYQDIGDALFNSLLAEAQYATAPIILTGNRQFYEDYERGQVAPGKIYYVPGGTADDNVRPIQFQLNPATLQTKQHVLAEADNAFPDNPSLPPGTRQVTAAINIWSSGRAARMGSIISSIKSGLERYARKLWMVLREYEAREPAAVFDMHMGSRPSEEMFIGPVHIEIKVPDILATENRVAAIRDLITGQLGEMASQLGTQGIEQLAAAINQQLGPELDTLTIHSAWRNDISWKATGGETTPDKMIRREGMQAVLQILPMAIQINPQRAALTLYEGLSRFLDVNDISDYREILGEPPPPKVTQEEAQAIMVNLQQFLGYQRMGVLGANPKQGKQER